MKLEEYTVVIHDADWVADGPDGWLLEIAEYRAVIRRIVVSAESSHHWIDGSVSWKNLSLGLIRWTNNTGLELWEMKKKLEEIIHRHNSDRQSV